MKDSKPVLREIEEFGCRDMSKLVTLHGVCGLLGCSCEEHNRTFHLNALTINKTFGLEYVGQNQVNLFDET